MVLNVRRVKIPSREGLQLRTTSHYLRTMTNAAAKTRKRPKAPLDHEPTAVKYAREMAGLTQTALAERIGKSISLVSEIESGGRNATPEVLRLIADALNCPIVVLQRKREP